MKQLYLFIFLALCYDNVMSQVRGRVLDETGAPLPGATVQLAALKTFSDADGRFDFNLKAGLLKISYIGYRDTSLNITGDATVKLTKSTGGLKEVIVSTGYQVLPKERATGSFVQVDRTLLERSVGTSVIDRLKDVVPGLSFNTYGSSLSIRGQSTLFSNAEPLIVVDGFPYNQPVADLNPDDIAGISILKDAAAASIWGAKAANGVIVITTKKGAFNSTTKVSGSASVNIGAKPDLFYQPRMSTSDYIDLEQKLFSAGAYTATESSTAHLPLSPVVELLIAARDGKIPSASATAQINALRNIDVRNDISRYLYRQSLNQQYAANVSGGTANQRYFFSAGYDQNRDNLPGNGFERMTLNANDTWSFLDKKLEFSAALFLSQNKTERNNPGNVYWNRGQNIYPYADLSGNVVHDYRTSFLTSAQQAGLLDWSYRPLDEVYERDNTLKLLEQRINTGLKYRLPLGLTAQVLYQYAHTNSTGRDLQTADSYYSRNLINKYTQVAGTVLTRPIPLGGIIDLSNSASVNHDIRGQLDYTGVFGLHEINAIAGYEVQTLNVLSDSYRLYGYDDTHATAMPVDGLSSFGNYDNPAQSTNIPMNISEGDATDHYRSYYANAAYTYDRRFSVSASARLDQSNLFGVKTNQKGVPLWSLGLSWKATDALKLRATYGYNGNINKSLSSYTTATYIAATGSVALLPYAQIVNPPNPELRWERVRHINLGIDWTSDRLNATLELYFKQGYDLIGLTAYAPSTGITSFTGNTANTSGRGLDLSLESKNLVGKFGWTTNFFISRATDKVTAYGQASTSTNYLNFGMNGGYALLDKPLYAVYSYRWAGLDQATGDPQGYLNGELSKNYTAIIGGTLPNDLVYNGPSRPPVFGALRNTFSYRNFSLSANVIYKLGYYYRRNSISYGTDGGLAQQSGDYALRWQKAGDEMNTNVPSAPAVSNTARDQFYRFSSALVEKGDHIRLQDLRLAYQHKAWQLYAYAANIGILWRANKSHQDPDLANFNPVPLTVAAGIRFTLTN